jgi:hypothetical protein
MSAVMPATAVLGCALVCGKTHWSNSTGIDVLRVVSGRDGGDSTRLPRSLGELAFKVTGDWINMDRPSVQATRPVAYPNYLVYQT